MSIGKLLSLPRARSAALIVFISAAVFIASVAAVCFVLVFILSLSLELCAVLRFACVFIVYVRGLLCQVYLRIIILKMCLCFVVRCCIVRVWLRVGRSLSRDRLSNEYYN